MPQICFEQAFKALTGHHPLNWQSRLFNEYFLPGRIPESVNVPTGLGKTAIMALWLIALAKQSSIPGLCDTRLPRRLVYVVDRRVVVDQATTFAERIRSGLMTPACAELREALGLKEAQNLAISTLRGQFTDNRDWLTDPAAPAIIVGTVDMIGSRIFFQGYGVSRKMRPYHAALLGTDSLILLDEAHLIPSFESILHEIRDHREPYGPEPATRELIPPLRVLPLSATPRAAGQPFRLTPEDLNDDIAIKRMTAYKKLEVKEFKTVLNASQLAQELADEAWKLCHEHTEDTFKPHKIVIYCDSRDVAEKTARALKAHSSAKQAGKKFHTELLVGARRIRDRNIAESRLEELGFLGDQPAQVPSFLVATAAGEVGVDIDADHLVCDLVAWERMVQRFGRVNRKGSRDDTRIVVIAAPPEEKPSKPRYPSRQHIEAPVAIVKPKKPRKPGKKASAEKMNAYEEALSLYQNEIAKYNQYLLKQKEYENFIKDTQQEDEARKDHLLRYQNYYTYRYRLILLKRYLKGDASPSAISKLTDSAQSQPALMRLTQQASSPVPLRPPLSRQLVDAWSMTSLTDHTGRPDISPWLRGWAEETPETKVVWRRHLPARVSLPVTSQEIESFFEAAPVHSSEVLETETFRVEKWLKKRIERVKHLPKEDILAIILSNDGKWVRSLGVSDILNPSSDDKKGLVRDLAGNYLIVNAELGGIENGLLNDSADLDYPFGENLEIPFPVADDSSNQWMDEQTDPPLIRFRITSDNHRDETETLSSHSDWYECHRFVQERDAEGSPLKWLTIWKWKDASNNENDRAEGPPQTLTEHQSWVRNSISDLGGRLTLPDHYIRALCIAAQTHDEGKKAPRWQKAFNAARDIRDFHLSGPLAKTRGPVNPKILDGYRHEFGSLPELENSDDFGQLSPELQELVRHIVAAHHGFARPIIPFTGSEDAPPSTLSRRALDVAIRFAKLQRRWGPWGLAWWEALLRAADAQASRRNTERSSGNV